MKIYISCDMEGTAGVHSWKQVEPSDTADYPTYRRYMSREVRAAIDGARDAGATDVLINDSHYFMRNILWDELPHDVRMISGYRKPFSMAEGIDASFAGAFFTGYHGAIGTQNAVLAHSYSPGTVYEVAINGVACSEALLNAALIGTYGVPVLFVTGDCTTCDQVRERLPWVVTAVVKESIGYYAADSIAPEAARALIRERARDAVKAIESAQPFTFTPPISLEIQTVKVESADFIEMMPGFTRTGPRRVRFDHVDYRVVFKAFLAAMRLGAAATTEA